jgi:predicted metal-dependent phosphotriesterase family hydrolase
MIENGYLAYVLISQDVRFMMDLQRLWRMGYAHILIHIVPMFCQVSVGDDIIRQIIVVNAGRAFAIRHQRMRQGPAKDR